MANENRRGAEAPEIIKAEDIVALLRQGVRASYQIEMRGVKIPVRVLSADEMNGIRQECIKNNVVTQGDETDKNLRIQKVTLTAASTVPVGTAPMLSQKVLGMLSIDEIGHLFDEYIGVMEQVNPSLETISAERFEAICEALKKKAVSPKELSLLERNAICQGLQDGTLIQAKALSQLDNSSGSSLAG